MINKLFYPTFDLFGSYRFTRIISSPNICISGVARFELTGKYVEQGDYVLDGKRYDCYREEQWVHEQGTLRIYHKGVLLHILQLAEDEKVLRHTHLCGQDNYAFTLTIHDNDHFTIEYQVTGPHKDYAINTEFYR